MRRMFALIAVLGCGTVEPTGTYGPANTSMPTSAADTSSTTTDGCVVGSEGCPCTRGGACDPALACLSDVCVDPGPVCPVGTKNCPCTIELGCDAGLECTSNHCVPAG